MSALYADDHSDANDHSNADKHVHSNADTNGNSNVDTNPADGNADEHSDTNADLGVRPMLDCDTNADVPAASDGEPLPDR